MRVLHVTISFHRGGKRIAIASLIEGLRKLGVESSLCLLDELGCAQDEIISLGVKAEVLSRRSLFDRAALARFRKLCNTENIDVIHTHDAASQATAVLATLGRADVPVLMTFHRSLGFESATLADRLRNGLVGLQCGAIVVGSQERREHFLDQNFVSARKVVRIPFGTDLSQFHPDPESRAAVRKELGFSPESTVIGTIGHFGPEKGVDIAIRAFLELKSRPTGGPLFLAIFGEGPRKQELERLAETAGRDGRAQIRFIGFRDDIHRCMRGMDVLLHAPRLEAFGLVIIEAMASGLPVVASRIGGIPDLVRDGRTGFLAEVENPKSFADSMEQMLNNRSLLAKMGETAHRVALAEYGRELYARRHVMLYEHLRAHRSPPLPAASAEIAQ